MLERYRRVRNFSEWICDPLQIEDYVIQSMPDVSPAKWHLAHTSWFFEAFILTQAPVEHRVYHPSFNYLFNSYYVTIGERHARPQRGLLSRPTVNEVYAYRRHVDEGMERFIQEIDESDWKQWLPIFELGLHHEQQHQELMLTDIKHVFSINPLAPVYRATTDSPSPKRIPEMEWIQIPEGAYEIGHTGGGFCYDNETPRHKQYLNGCMIASRLVTNGQYLAFIEDGGYLRHELWLSEGWDCVHNQGWKAPLYWLQREGEWRQFTLFGLREIDLSEPVCHVSYFEADAYARWLGARLPTEAEWEIAADRVPVEGIFLDCGRFHPAPLSQPGALGVVSQLFGDVWEWTSSPYTPYPGYAPSPGALGEYNGKWMCNQYVLRGGSCATPESHIRRTYRNFFPAQSRWQFMGIRLAK